MEPEKIASEIEKLNISEKLILIQNIWDSIAIENDNLPMPEWQKIELKKRYDLYKYGKTELYDWQDIHNSLRENYK